MKKNRYINAFVFLIAIIVSLPLKAQKYVSPNQEYRNVIIEKITQRSCGFCPEADLISNEIEASHPGRVWTIAIHDNHQPYEAGSDTTYPNLNTTVMGPLKDACFGSIAYPRGLVNRSTTEFKDRFIWDSLTNARLEEYAECNVGGIVNINRETREATIAVEVFYTENSVADTNLLTIVMVQDSILGYQNGGSYYNPSQIVNGTYCHMHILRDVITRNLWGDIITPTTAGTLVTKLYHYQIPDTIGNPNGVAVDLDNIHFIAWVGERFQTHYYHERPYRMVRPLLNVGEMENYDEIFRISVSPNFPEGGVITGDGSYFDDMECTLQATPKTGWFFNGWRENGSVVSTEPTYTFIVHNDRNLEAEFEKAAKIEVRAVPYYGAMVTGEGYYRIGETVTATATPMTNYVFQHWTIEEEEVSTNPTYSFTATDDCTLLAIMKHGTGVNETEKQTLVYPNPVSNVLVVETDETIESLQIYTLTGTLVYSQKDVTSHAEIPTDKLPVGTYFLSITTQGTSTTQKIIINKQ